MYRTVSTGWHSHLSLQTLCTENLSGWAGRASKPMRGKHISALSQGISCFHCREDTEGGGKKSLPQFLPIVSFQDEQFLLQMVQLTMKEPVGHGPRQGTAAGKGLPKGCLFARLSWLLGFPECHALSPGDSGQAARVQVHAKLCPGISGVGLQHRQGLACGSQPRSHVAV